MNSVVDLVEKWCSLKVHRHNPVSGLVSRSNQRRRAIRARFFMSGIPVMAGCAREPSGSPDPGCQVDQPVQPAAFDWSQWWRFFQKGQGEPS